MNPATVFVKIDEYKQVLETVASIKKNLGDAKKVLSELNAIKDAENAELASWGANLEEIEAKLSDMDKLMIDPGQW